MSQVYKELLQEKLQVRRKDREIEDRRRQEARDEEDDALEWVFRAKQLTLFEVPEPVPYFEALCRISRRICAAPLEEHHQEALARKLEKELLQVVIAGFSFLMQESVDTVSYGHRRAGLSEFLAEMKSAQDALYRESLQGSYNDLGNSDGGSSRELARSLLHQAREDEDNELAEERSEEDEECTRETFSESLNDANFLISAWIKATIEAYGGSLVLDTARKL